MRVRGNSRVLSYFCEAVCGKVTFCKECAKEHTMYVTERMTPARREIAHNAKQKGVLPLIELCGMQRFCLLEGKDTVPVSSPQTPYLYTHIFQASRGRQFLRKLFATCSVGRPPTALRSLNGFATLAWSVFPLHNLLLLALRSSSQLLLLGFCSYRAKAYSHVGCALAPSRCSHP